MRVNNLVKGAKVIPTRKFEREQWGLCSFLEMENRGDGVVIVEDKRGNHHFIQGNKLREPTNKELLEVI